LFRKTPLKAQNDDIFEKCVGGMAPLAPPGYAYALAPLRKFSAYATDLNVLICITINEYRSML